MAAPANVRALVDRLRDANESEHELVKAMLHMAGNTQYDPQMMRMVARAVRQHALAERDACRELLDLLP